MSRHGSFRYSVSAHCDVPTAMALLSDLSRQGELHPLIVTVERREAEEGALASYAITDRLALGPFSMTIVYTADVMSVTDTEIVTVAHQRPATTVRNHTTVTAVDGGVRVDVEITLTAPAPLFGFAMRTAHRAHTELGERIGLTLDALGRASQR